MTSRPHTHRENIRMDTGWRFAFGHPFDTEKDFLHATGYFSFLTKTGYGDGPAAADFDDRAWRLLDLPHDWAVEAGFSAHAGHSHGYKTVGRGFPETSVGWYRKTFDIPAEDLGRRISVEFDGIHRDASVWVNGFFLGRESSGYDSYAYDITDYLNYGGSNTISVRADVTLEEGWFYEGAGIYRHVRLVKTGPVHVARHGIFVSTETDGKKAEITIRAKAFNRSETGTPVSFRHVVKDSHGTILARGGTKSALLPRGESLEIISVLKIRDPRLWSLEDPRLHTLESVLVAGKTEADRVTTVFGIRTVRFDPEKGFFLNGCPVKLKGTNNHQDHAGVGTAMPDGLQEFRIRKLKEFGCNAYRCSHNPPTPELLDACDRLGMLVLPENRLLGVTPQIVSRLERMILRDRNHPCVIAWSIGNEEWAVEGNEKGAAITATLQKEALRLDPTRRVTVAVSGGWGRGISTVVDVMGYNYISHGNTDEHHAKYPAQTSMGTEESTTSCGRGVYEDDREHGYLAPLDRTGVKGEQIETGWTWYAERPYLAGCFFWTGFDYRGEPNPLNWPAVLSSFGLLDTCGFPKDGAHYLKAWWSGEPFLKITPHWNWAGREGREILVRVYSNCAEVELFLNARTLGKKTMKPNSRLDWMVPYEPGILKADGYSGARIAATDKAETAGPAASLLLVPDRPAIESGGDAVSVVTVLAADETGRAHPTSDAEIVFSLSGPGKIIGVGNGDPASHEPDRFVEDVRPLPLTNWRSKPVDSMGSLTETAFEHDDGAWERFHIREDEKKDVSTAPAVVYRAVFELPESTNAEAILLFPRAFGESHDVHVNGQPIDRGIGPDDIRRKEFRPDPKILRSGKNIVAVVAAPFRDGEKMKSLARAQALGSVRLTIPAAAWRRRLFNGLAQVIVQSLPESGTIALKAESAGLKSAEIRIRSEESSRERRD